MTPFPLFIRLFPSGLRSNFFWKMFKGIVKYFIQIQHAFWLMSKAAIL